MTDPGPKIREIARNSRGIRLTTHAKEEMHKEGIVYQQVETMLKGCTNMPDKGDSDSYRVRGRAPAGEGPGSIEFEAHIKLIRNSDQSQILVITIIGPKRLDK